MTHLVEGPQITSAYYRHSQSTHHGRADLSVRLKQEKFNIAPQGSSLSGRLWLQHQDQAPRGQMVIVLINIGSALC